VSIVSALLEIRNQQVRGSSPRAGSTFLNKSQRALRGGWLHDQHPAVEDAASRTPGAAQRSFLGERSHEFIHSALVNWPVISALS
jgi:hypothetical protein